VSNVTIANKLPQRVDVSLQSPGGGVEGVKLDSYESIPNAKRPQAIAESSVTQYTRGLAEKGYVRIRKG
jgi:hypothetical protein